MQRATRILTLCTILFIANLCYAINVNNTLVVTLVNHSNNTLNYTGVTKTNPGSAFIVTPTTILPGGAATITATNNSPFSDLAGFLHFNDEKNNASLFQIIDHRLINYTHPTFTMHNQQFISFIKSKTMNLNLAPRALSYIAATIVIEENVVRHHIMSSL